MIDMHKDIETDISQSCWEFSRRPDKHLEASPRVWTWEGGLRCLLVPGAHVGLLLEL